MTIDISLIAKSPFFILPALLLSGILRAGGAETKPTGFVGLENDSGVWWFKAPNGAPFLSLGFNHIEPVYWQSPNNEVYVRETYGPELFLPDGSIRDGSPSADKWARKVAANFQDWGFNTFGFHNPLLQCLHAADPASYYVVELGVRYPWGWNMTRSELTRAFKKRPMDIFGDAFVAEAGADAEKLVKPRAGDPQVLGYAYTDGPPWTVKDDADAAVLANLTPAERTLHPWVLSLMSLPADAKGKQAWVAQMKERYPSPEKAGEVYGCKIGSWEDMASRTVWTEISDTAKAQDDSRAFLEKIMRQWYEIRKNAIRKYDKNHLILGDKLNMNRDWKYPEQLARCLHLMKDYVDVINIQYYAPFGEQHAALDFLYKESGKPVLAGDTACNPLWEDNPVENTGFYAKLGATYADHLAKLFSLPYFIGWHHCGYMRGLRTAYVNALKQGDQTSIDFHVRSKHTYREGFVSEFEEPIIALVTPLREAVRNCGKLHRASGDVR